MNSSEIRNAFLETFEQVGFRKSQPLSLVQPSIATSFLFSVGFVDVMETVAGKSVSLNRTATLQRCFRHFDMERVSDGRHLSFFEMAGALQCEQWKIEDLLFPLVRYLVEICGIPMEKLHATYFGGGLFSGTVLPPDNFAHDAYFKAGFSDDHIWAGDAMSNIWAEGANSGTERSGICGPNSEIFLDRATDVLESESPLVNPDRFIELSNIVTITHCKPQGSENGIMPLPTPLVELALGMERLEMAFMGVSNLYEIPRLRAIRDSILSHCNSNSIDDLKMAARADGTSALHIAVDHFRALAHLFADGGRPGGKGRGYVIRKMFRRLFQATGILRLDARKIFPTLATLVAEVDHELNPGLSIELSSVLQLFDEEAHRIMKIGAANA